MSMRVSYTVENVLHYSIPVSNHLLNKAFKLLRHLSFYYLQQRLFKIYETLVLI